MKSIKKIIARLMCMLIVSVVMVNILPTTHAVDLDPKYVAETEKIYGYIEESKSNQDKAHQMAELAREFGLEEDSETIQTAKLIWETEAVNIAAYESQLETLSNVDLHYYINSSTGLSVEAFNKMLSGTALAGEGDAFYDMEQNYNVNAVFAMGVANTESTLGAACYGYNPFGMMGSNGLIRYDSWYSAIQAFGKLMNKNWYKGKSIEGMARTYCPTNSNWPNEVKYSMAMQYNKIQ